MTSDASAGHWRVVMSPYTYHYSRDPNHRHVYMLGLERQRDDGLVWGGTYFRNSFGQPSGYGFFGKRFNEFMQIEPLFVQATGGVLYGYRGEYANKVPLNHNGWSPGAVLSVGWQFTPRLSTQIDVLGNSALMFQFSIELK